MLLFACGRDPFAPGSEWLIGRWKFEEGGCWPEIVVTPETLGFSLEIDLAGNGTSEVRHDGSVVDRPRFTVRMLTFDFAPEGSLILEFDRDVIRSRKSFKVFRQESGGLGLADYGITDACGFIFVRQP